MILLLLIDLIQKGELYCFVSKSQKGICKMNREGYFFCYSTNLLEFLRYKKGQRYVCTAFHDKTMKRFWLFEKTEELNQSLTEYTEHSRKLGLINI